ncbi:MAG: HpcH/HpaI aldolase family protein [Candidatus Acetothermia bacterium]
MRNNILRSKIEEDEISIGTRMMTPWPGMVEIIGETGKMDYVEFSSEYSPYDLFTFDNLARASEIYDLSMMIKVDQALQRYLAQRALGAGFQNVLFTDIRTVEDAKDCVRAVRAETPKTGGLFPCTARRNVGYLREGGTPEFVQALEDAVVALMIEKKPAMENLEDILSVDGVDMVQFGPCDYAMSIGKPGEYSHPEVVEAEQRMIEAALDHDVQPRAEILQPGDAKKYYKMGVRHFNINVDISIVHNWIEEKGAELRDILSELPE